MTKTYQDAITQGAIPQPVTLMDTSGNAYNGATTGSITNDGTFARENGGNLATIAGAVSGGKAAVKAAANDIVDLGTIAGVLAKDSLGNLKVGASAALEAILAGTSYIATTGLVAGPGTTNQTTAFSFWVPNTNTKNILLYSLHVLGGSGTLNRMRTQPSDPAFANSITPINLKIGGSVSALSNITYSNTNQSSTGTEWQPIGIPSNDMKECLSYPILIPASTAWGLVVYMFLSGANSNWGVSARWIEF